MYEIAYIKEFSVRSWFFLSVFNNNFHMYVDIVHVFVKNLLFSLIWPILSCVYHDIVKVSIVAVFDYFLCFNWNELPFLAVTDKLYKQVNKLILPSKSVW